MSTSQRISRGFHWLGLLLAVIPLVVAIIELASAWNITNEKYDALVCIHENLPPEPDESILLTAPGFPFVSVSLDKIGCRGGSILITQEELREHGPGGQLPSWLAIFVHHCKGALQFALAALAVYSFILLIGWAVKSGPVGRAILRLIAVVLAALGAWFFTHAYLLYDQGGPTPEFVTKFVTAWVAIGVGLFGLAVYLWTLKRD